MIYRILCFWCILVLSFQENAAAFGSRPSIPAVASGDSKPEDRNPYVWGARFFLSQVTSWLFGKGLDYAAQRTGLLQAGRNAVTNLNTILVTPGFSQNEKARISVVRNDIQRILMVLQQTNRTTQQLRQDLASLRLEMHRSITELEREVVRLDERISQVELAQRRQMRQIVDMQGQIVDLQRTLVLHDGRIVQLEQRTAALEQTTRKHDKQIGDLERVVYPDPNRYLRHEWIVSGAALYANSPTLNNDAKIGGELTAQYNLSKHFGVFANLLWAPISASDAEGFPSDSRVYWESVGVGLGASVNFLPPQSYVSLQVGGGGGIFSNSLSEYPNGASISETEAAVPLGEVSNAALIGKADLGISPPAVGLEPFASFTYVRFLDNLVYQDDVTSTDAGNALWYVSLGLRLRTYDRRRSQ